VDEGGGMNTALDKDAILANELWNLFVHLFICIRPYTPRATFETETVLKLPDFNLKVIVWFVLMTILIIVPLFSAYKIYYLNLAVIFKLNNAKVIYNFGYNRHCSNSLQPIKLVDNPAIAPATIVLCICTLFKIHLYFVFWKDSMI